MPRESSIVAAVARLAKQRGWWVMKIHGGPYQLVGVPDLLCIKQGRALFLEVKQPGKHATAIQRSRMNEIETQGGAACFVVHNYEEADARLRTDETGFRESVDDSTLGRRRRRALPAREKR